LKDFEHKNTEILETILTYLMVKKGIFNKFWSSLFGFTKGFLAYICGH